MARLALVAAIGAAVVVAMVANTVTDEDAATRGPPSAGMSYVLPLSEGYGTTACITGGGDCGAEVARALCEARGFVSSVSYAPAEGGTSIRIDCRA